MHYDYIVIGAGSAGCAVAYELAKSGEARVLVLESGGTDRSLFIQIPAGQVRAIKHNDWGFTSQPDPTRQGRSETWSRGRVLGGSSSVNGMMYVRGAAADFDRWARLGNRGWTYADVSPIFRDMESSDQDGPLRGRQGPVSVRTVTHAHELTDAFVRSAVAAGCPFNDDYNGASQEGVGYAQLSQRNGVRCSAAGAFLKPLLGRNRNLTLSLRSTVVKIDVQRGRASSISFVRDGALLTAAARHIILCSGAINTPQLLMLSGIGDPCELERHDIDVHVESPDVGKHLQEHPLIRLTYKVRIPSNNLTEGWGQKLRIAAQYLRARSGPIAHLFEAAAFLRSTTDEAGPDIQLHFLPIGYAYNEAGVFGSLDYPSVTVLLNKSHPRSRGRIRLTNKDPGSQPLIECRLMEDEADVQTLVRGVEMVRRIMATNPIATLVECETTPTVAVPSLHEYVRNNAEIAYHPSGTCRMGPDSRSVVTPELRVNGVDNLWVADASVMPDLISGNTNAVCMMIGMKLGRQLRSTA
jgi:choline dehydrogenase